MTLACDWLVLCEQVLADRQSGNLTLITCLDQISASQFPALHPRFAFVARMSWTGEGEPLGDVVEYRLVRYSETDAEEEVSNLKGKWAAGARKGRVYANFSFIRLWRAETIWFRLSWRVGGGAWEQGPSVPLDVAQLDMTAEMRAQLEQLGRLAQESRPQTKTPDPER
jgi:hypothetical protein